MRGALFATFGLILLLGPSLVLLGWLLWMAHRAVRALESIADALQKRNWQ
ncbi:MAG: hypothetical protein L6E13_11310 [Firmicutes bacterium]|nr:hypothetical protein [Bacillota bacterium]